MAQLGEKPVAGGRFVVVENAELEFSIWPTEVPPPAGWNPTGVTGSEDECLDHVGRTWIDMRPRSVRMSQPAARDQLGEHPTEVVPGSSAARGAVVPIADVSISELIDRRNERAPEEIAVRFAGDTLTRSDLGRRTRRLASRLSALGAAPERIVAMLLPRSADAVVGILAILKSGSAYLPLSTSDPVSRLLTVLRDAGNPPVLTDAAGQSKLSGYDGVVTLLGDDAEDHDGPAKFPVVTGENLAYVMYTSGTSGPPKGVLGTHRQLVNYVRWCSEEFALEPGERALLHAPLYFVGSVMTLFTALATGWELDVAPEPVAFDELRDQARDGCCGFLKLTPSHVRALTAIGDVADLARLYMIGSEPLNLTPALAGWIAESPSSRFGNHYGMSETCGATWYWVSGDEPAGERLPVGKPIFNAEVCILGPTGERLPYGEVGELCLSGLVIGRGYYGAPALTARRWRPHPWGQPGERLLHTGDLARMTADGIVEVLGRADRQVKIRGHRIALPAVEEAVLRCPGVAEAVVSVLPDGQDVPRLTALLRAAPGEQPQVGLIRERLLGELPEPWVPSRFLVTREFPLTPNGKIDYACLAGSRGVRPETAGEFSEPATAAEKALCDIFAEVLQLERVGAGDDFRDLGGDSMNVVQVISLAHEAGVEVSIGEFFEHGTPRALAALARATTPVPLVSAPAATASLPDLGSAQDGGIPAEEEPLVTDPTGRIQRVAVPFAATGRSAPLTWGQMHMWRPMRWYGQSFAGLNIVRIIDLGTPGAELAACQDAVRRLAETYEPVRSRFIDSPDGPVQQVAAAGVFQLEVLDAAPGEIEDRASERARQLAAELFDHARQWPVRICLVRSGESVRSIAIVASHLAFDGWSMERLTVSLSGWISGDSLDLPEPVQPVDEAAEERSPRGQQRNAQSLAHWREKLAELPPSDQLDRQPELPREDPPWQRWAIWSADIAARAAELAARTRTSTSAVMLTLAEIATAALQGRDTVGLLLISGNRFTHRERQLAGSVLQDAVTVYHHQDVPLSAAIKETYRAATEAYYNARCDPIALDAVRDEAGRPDLSWYFNDARLGREWEHAATGNSAAEPFLVHGFENNDMSLCLGLAQRGPNCEVSLLADTAVLSAERIRGFLHGLEPLLSRVLSEELSTSEVARVLLESPRVAPSSEKTR